MPDSGDCSDAEMNQPSCSRKTVQSHDREKSNRRIIMRIEFSDSDDTDEDSACLGSSKNNNSATVSAIDLGTQEPLLLDSQSCSGNQSDVKTMVHSIKKPKNNIKRVSNHRHRIQNNLNRISGSEHDSGSEVDERLTRRLERGKKRMKLLISEDDDENSAENNIGRTATQADPELGFNSDSSTCSSSNEMLEKCPICLLTFRQQQIGRPVTCEHMFCATCIESWANNVQTCPIDRLAFNKIIVLHSFGRRNVIREISLDFAEAKKELVLNDEEYIGVGNSDDDDATNCEICNCPDREDIMLLCDSCNRGYHMDCLDPPLLQIPGGSWYCEICGDSNVDTGDEELELAEDLHTLLEDIRGMGLPETRLRVRQVQHPRILRTRQNERIRAAVLRHTRSNSLRQTLTGDHSETIRIARSTARRNNTSSISQQRRRRRRKRHRTYVVEYDLNSFDEKFAVKTRKKVIKRKRRRKASRISEFRKTNKNISEKARTSASKRLAEQLGVKTDGVRGSHISGGSASSFTLFGNPNDLEYFSDNDDVRSDIGGYSDNGNSASTAVQASVRLTSIGAPRNRKALLLGKARAVTFENNSTTSPLDLLSSIMDLQDRWHNASRNLSEVRINADGSLNLPQRSIDTYKNTTTKVTVINRPIEHITQVPLYQRGGAGPNFSRSGNGSYNNRYSGENTYRAGSGNVGSSNNPSANNQYQRHTTGSLADNSESMPAESTLGNQAYNSNNNVANNSTLPNTEFTPFNIRFNTPSQTQQRNQNVQQSRQSSYSMHSTPDVTSSSFGHIIPQQQPQHFGTINAPINTPALGARISMPPILSVPPPPAPPPSLSWNSSLFKVGADFEEQNKARNEDGDDDENCPNFSIYSQESQAVATELFTLPQNSANKPEKDDEEMNEDLVQLDDDDDIPLPPDPHTEQTVSSTQDKRSMDLYEPENPTDDQTNDQNDITKKSNQSVEDNVKKGSENLSPGKEVDDDDETKMHSTPSPLNKDGRTLDRGKGVLELYDDSDWEELEIDRPKEFEKALVKETKEEKSTVVSDVNTEGVLLSHSSSESVQNRSYTPCLDEKNIEEDTATGTHKDKSEVLSDAKKDSSKKMYDSDDEEERVAGMSTELISEDEELTNENESKRRSRSRSRQNREDESKVGKAKRNNKRGKENSETFKKVGKRRKDRNYRGEKLHRQNRSPRRSHSNTPCSDTRSYSSHSRNYSRSRSRSRSISLSSRGRRRNSRSKSYSRSRSQSHSPHGGRHRGFRGREYNRGVGRNRGGLRYNFRNPTFNHRQHQQHQHQYQSTYHHNQHYQHQNQYHMQSHYQRPKRRELPRYDVRNVVSNSRNHQKDRYGRDATRPVRSRSISYERRQRSRSYSRNVTRSRSHSGSPKRFRSFSISPSPHPSVVRHHHEQGLHQRSLSPGSRRLDSQPISQTRCNSPTHRSNSIISHLSRSNTPARINGSRSLQGSKRSPVYSPRYTPQISRSASKSPRKKKKKKSEKKKKSKKRPASSSPGARQRRISRQRDPFDDAEDFLAPQLGKKSKKSAIPIGGLHWSPSPTPSLSVDHLNLTHESGLVTGGEKPISWTPPLISPQLPCAPYDNSHRSPSPVSGKKVRPKRDKNKKKKKPLDKQRKEKKRKRHTMTPEPLPSKEVFASGNNILVSVSFNKEGNSNALVGSTQQQTIVTLPPNREDFLGGRRTSIDRLTNNSGLVSKKTKRKRKKLDAKPVAIIDLERSPFQVHQEPADVIVLTDSEDANDNQLLLRRERRHNSLASATDHDMIRDSGQREKTPPENCLETILEASYETLTQTTGPKTPPEPHLVKFNLPAKKQHKVRNNPLHDDADDIHSADELETVCTMRSAVDSEPQQSHDNEKHISVQKIGPNTPPESGPCSPDAYDPFEPTKSPSLSPSSPTPNTTQNVEQISTSISGVACSSVEQIDVLPSSQKHNSHNDDLVDVSINTPTLSNASNATTQTNNNASNVSINPVDLVMALMNKPSNSIQQELAIKSCDVSSTQYLNSTTMSTACAAPNSDDKTSDKLNTITVLSNVLLTSSTVVSASQHIPIISSPSTTQIRKLNIIPGASGSVASSSSGVPNLPSSNANMRNGNNGGNANSSALDDSFNMDIESPYSPGSADYEDLFEPPPDGSNATGTNRRLKSNNNMPAAGKAEMFDNLFGSSSPVSQLKIPSTRYINSGGRKHQRAHNKNERKSKIKGGKPGGDHVKLYDDVPNSAVDLQVKDKFIRKLNRQERVVEEVKLVLKPHFNKKIITKEDYKDIMRRAVPKICHSRSGEINPHKIKNLIDAYVRKFRAKHKKLSLLNTGQVSSAVKCAAYLKKL